MTVYVFVKHGVVDEVYGADVAEVIDWDILMNGSCPFCQDALDKWDHCRECNISWNVDDNQAVIDKIEIYRKQQRGA